MKSAPDELLGNAKKAWDDGDKGTADHYCRQILETYPDSNAAQDAKEILDGLVEQSVSKPPTSVVTDSHSQSSKYTTARGVAFVIEFLGWSFVVIGIFAMIYASSKQQGVVGVLIGIGVIVGGLLQIMGAQIVRATVDTADNTNAILTELRERPD